MHPEQEKKKILVVDDEFDMRVFLAAVLEAGGFYPIVASNTDEGLDLAVRENPSLIILDPLLMTEDGLRLFGCIKADEKLSCIPVIMVSSIDEKTFLHYQRAHTAHLDGAAPRPDGFLHRPPEAEELLQMLSSLTGGERP